MMDVESIPVTIHDSKYLPNEPPEFFWFLPQVVGLIYLGGWQYIPGICLVYTPQFGLSIYRPYIQRFARNYFLLISTSSLKNSRTGAHFYPNRKTGKKYKWANALVPPTPIWRAMVIRCYAMLSYMFPYLSCLSMIFTGKGSQRGFVS